MYRANTQKLATLHTRSAREKEGVDSGLATDECSGVDKPTAILYMALLFSDLISTTTKTHHITRAGSIHYAALLVINNCSGGGGKKDASWSRLLILQSDWRSRFRDRKGVRTKKCVNSYQTSLHLMGGASGYETNS